MCEPVLLCPTICTLAFGMSPGLAPPHPGPMFVSEDGSQAGEPGMELSRLRVLLCQPP